MEDGRMAPTVDELTVIQNRFRKQARAFLKAARQEKQSALTVSNNQPTDSAVMNTLISGAVGLGALGMLIPSYRFVQSARKGYKDKVEDISDVTRASQAWNALRQGREDDYMPLRAVLETEPDLLDEYRQKLRKKDLQKAMESNF